MPGARAAAKSRHGGDEPVAGGRRAGRGHRDVGPAVPVGGDAEGVAGVGPGQWAVPGDEPHEVRRKAAVLRTHCEAAGRDFVALTRDTYERHTGEACDVLINANGNSRKPLAREAPLQEFDASVRTVRSSLEDFHYDRYVHLSSCDVYPDCTSPATTQEDQALDPTAQSAYGFHKHLAELCVRNRAKDHLIFRLGGFVGPGLKKNAIFDILHGGPLWLDAGSELQFLHTDDCARIVLSLIDNGPRNQVLNLCGNGLVKLADVMGWTGREAVPVQPGSPRVRYDVSIETISRLLPIPESAETVREFIKTR
jgi:nucleoside-diphosphate-sugar epimerase